MKGREIVDFINKKGLLDGDLFLTDAYGNTYGYMTVEEYAADIGTGAAVVKTMIKRGDIPHIVIHGKILIPDHKNVSKDNKCMNEPEEQYETEYFLNTENIASAYDIRYSACMLIANHGYVKANALGFLAGNATLQVLDDSYGWTNHDDFLIAKINGCWGILVPKPQKLEV